MSKSPRKTTTKKLDPDDTSETLTIRIPSRLKQDLAAAAAKTDRSVTHYVIHALKTQMDLDQIPRNHDHQGG